MPSPEQPQMNADERRWMLCLTKYLRSFAFICGSLLVISAMAGRSWSAEMRQVPAHRAAAAGVRVIESRHLKLWTDLPPGPAVDELPAAFDAAVPLWGDYFGIPQDKIADWRVQGFLIQDRATFRALGLLPEEKPDFPNGFSQGSEVWLVEQPSDYYRRHLLLHEGVHALMREFLGGVGPGWYAEGMAELLGSHVWRRGELQLPAFPASRDAVPMWGRIKRLREAAVADKSFSLEAVLALEGSRAISDDAYAWTWALAALLDGHPQFHARFRELGAAVSGPDFNAAFRRAFAADWGDLQCEWQAYAAAIDYGYDFARMAMVHRDPVDVDSAGLEVEIRVDRGWQSTGAKLLAGHRYQITSSGRYVIAREGEVLWPCEPGGVTLRWHAGRPVGELQAALRPVAPSGSETGGSMPQEPSAATFSSPQSLGLSAVLTPDFDAILYVRVNDSPAELHDNEGLLPVTISGAD